ncbi:MAG: diguanylate cyclase (GGDEF)-like protein/PAS domain S-box-containing protein [Sulfurimonas sp.]|jgi:diguanylate cyclase (GGDEF)-like protein/PAS domain S-box-containing protein|uniref:EAL domain-containing protein n=1 Tax=Sulfurimonas sp. TaxID=2022749 RepID=UPI0039E2F09B
MNLQTYKEVIESELFEIGPIVAFIWENKENWPVFSVSKNIEKHYSHKPKDFLSNTLEYASLIHKDDLSRVYKEVMQASNSTLNSFVHKPYRLLVKDTEYKWIQDTTIILRSNNIITHYIGYITDITQLIELENKTLEQNKILLNHEALFKSYKLAMDESSIISKSDLNGIITYVNNNFCKISGFTREELLGKPHGFIRGAYTSDATFKNLWETIQNKKVWKGRLNNKGKLENYWVDTSILPILDENEDIVEYIAVRYDITEVIQQQQKLDELANTDTLTGYGNRYKLNHDIKHSTNPALAIINIDNFSQINDFYGHVEGDKVIKALGKTLSNVIQNEQSELYHLQGDEYVIFDSETSSELFTNMTTNLIAHIKVSPIKVKEEELYINVSTAISFQIKDMLLVTADMALKVAKKENKNLIIYSNDISLNNEYENNLKWTRKIKEAIDEDRIVPVFQPIVNNETNHWEKYEALVRIRDRDGTLITPYFFLEISKKTKHYDSITKIMLQKSFEIFKDKNLDFSVNLTIHDILNQDINNYIFEILKKYNIGNRVVFEIVESESIENFEKVALFIKNVKLYGVKIAIDDFGTGYSNFEYLMKLKPDYIKIDGSMIKNINTNTDAQMVISTIVDFAKKMNIKTIAEFVENEAIYKKVKKLGIDYTQGYYFSKPLDII